MKSKTKAPAAKKAKGKIQDRVKSWEDAYPIFLKKKFKDPLFLIVQKRKKNELTSHEKQMIFAEVLRNGWVARFNDGSQPKWFCVFYYDGAKTGFVLSDARTDYGSTHTDVGSRLSFPTEELAEHFGNNSLDLQNDYLIIK